jgi:hypothetical protein
MAYGLMLENLILFSNTSLTTFLTLHSLSTTPGSSAVISTTLPLIHFPLSYRPCCAMVQLHHPRDLVILIRERFTQCVTWETKGMQPRLFD